MYGEKFQSVTNCELIIVRNNISKSTKRKRKRIIPQTQALRNNTPPKDNNIQYTSSNDRYLCKNNICRWGWRIIGNNINIDIFLNQQVMEIGEQCLLF